MTTTCPTCGFSHVPSQAGRCPSCNAPHGGHGGGYGPGQGGAGHGGAPGGGGFAPPPVGAVPGHGAYAPGPPGGFAQRPGPPNVARDLDVGWMLWASIGLVFCCQPFGIAAFIFMDQAKTAYRLGDDARAEQKMQSMKTSIYIGIGLACTIVLLYLGMVVLGIAAAVLSRP